MTEFARNQELFSIVRQLDLPFGHYVITASGPMGVRNLREIRDFDLLVDDELWSQLAARYPVVKDHDVARIKLTDEVEVVGDGSAFIGTEIDSPSIKHQIEEAEIIDGLPFVALSTVRYFKLRHGRDKDLKDIKLIDDFVKNKP